MVAVIGFSSGTLSIKFLDPGGGITLIARPVKLSLFQGFVNPQMARLIVELP